jgi:hypothetical protein
MGERKRLGMVLFPTDCRKRKSRMGGTANQWRTLKRNMEVRME